MMVQLWLTMVIQCGHRAVSGSFSSDAAGCTREVPLTYPESVLPNALMFHPKKDLHRTPGQQFIQVPIAVTCLHAGVDT